MKLIFLDIDGVLNSEQSITNGVRLMPEACNLIDLLCSIHDAKIVITSTWRIGKTIKELQDMFFLVGIQRENIIGKTDSISDDIRGHEIVRWIGDNVPNLIKPILHNTEFKFCIIDDDDFDMSPKHKDNLVLCHGMIGFTKADFIKAHNILK